MSDEDQLHTKTGKVITEEELDALADQAERGYCVETVLRSGSYGVCGRPLDERGACPNPRGHLDG